jgi:hypothetical protein
MRAINALAHHKIHGHWRDDVLPLIAAVREGERAFCAALDALERAEVARLPRAVPAR